MFSPKASVAGGSAVLAVLQEKQSRRPQEKMRCGKIYSGGNRRLPLCPIFICPAIEQVQPCLWEGQNKGQCLAFLFWVPALAVSVPVQAALLYPGSLYLFVVPAAGCAADRPTWLLQRKGTCSPGMGKGREKVKGSGMHKEYAQGVCSC